MIKHEHCIITKRFISMYVYVYDGGGRANKSLLFIDTTLGLE